MEQILISDLIAKGKQIITTFGYKPSTIRHYHRHWDNLLAYFYTKGQVIFSIDTSDDFITSKETETAISASHLRTIRRAVYFLQECHLKEGNVTWNRIQRSVRKLDGIPGFENLLDEYTDSISTTLKKSTVKIYKRIAEKFLLYLKSRGINCFKETSQDIIKDSVNHLAFSYPKGMHVVLPVLRSLIRFITADDDSLHLLLWAIPQNACYRHPVISIVTDQELLEIDFHIRHSGVSPERDYAIFLLASRIGLRKSDIAGLTLDDIDWRQRSLKIVQQKTSEILELPLLNDVGNALCAYILNSRPSSHDRHVFIRNVAPYTGISPTVCSNIVRLAMKQCGIHEDAGMSQGTHCLRHYVARRMLSESVPLPIISSVLGHKDKESTRQYLWADTDMLRLCPLSFLGIEVQKEELL